MTAGLSIARGPASSPDRERSIHDLFSERARATPDRVAVRAVDGTLTYGDVEERSRRFAAALRASGVVPGDAVGIALERSIALPIALIGILKAGAAYVALDPGYPAERLSFVARDAALRLIVTGDAGRARFAATGVPILGPDADAGDDATRGFATVRRGASDLAYVAYTSGSTGRAKGVAVPHRGVVRLARHTNFVDVAPDDTFLQFAPLAFDASTLEIWAPLLNGATLAIAPPCALGIDDVGEAVESFGVTTMWLTATLFHHLADAASPRFRGLRVMITGGDVVSPVHARRFLRTYPACRLINGYGPTENTTFSTTHEIGPRDEAATRIPIGRPIAGSSAYVLDESGRPAPLGTPGELYVGGDGVALGYVGLEPLSAERFLPDPFAERAAALMYRTGDRAVMRTDGIVEFLGRSDDQVKVRGYRVELGEIEAALRALPGVRTAAVVTGRSSGEKTLVAYVVSAPGSSDDEGSVRAALAATLPRYLVPHRIVVTDALPAHASGKIDRVALELAASAAPLADPAAASRSRRRPAGSSLERRIGEHWNDVLGRSDSGPGENFFDAGGDSMLLLVLKRRLDADDIPVSVVELFEHTSVRRLAAFVERRTARSASAS